MSQFTLPPPSNDKGEDLLGLGDISSSPGYNFGEDSSVASTSSAASDAGLTGGTIAQLPPSTASSALSSAASSTANLTALGLSSQEPESGFEGGAIGTESTSETTEKQMHNSNMGFFDRIAKESSHTDSYGVTFPAGPIGISLEKDSHGRQCLVRAFRQVKDDQNRLVDGPAKRSGLIVIGDVVTAIDGEDVLELTFQQTMMRLRAAQEKEHTLTFKSMEHVGDLSGFGGDQDLKETKKLIHQQKEKWYLSPVEASDDVVYCYVERIRGNSVTAFNLHREDTGEYMFSCSCDSSMQGEMIFHTMKDSHLRELKHIHKSEDAAAYLGCAVSNAWGTEFTFHDHKGQPWIENKELRELGVVRYDQNVMGRIPNFMTCLVPRPEAEHEKGEQRRVQKKSIVERFDHKEKAPVEKNVGDHIVDFFAEGFKNMNPFKSKEEGGRDLGIGVSAVERRKSVQEMEDEEDDEADLAGYGGLEQDDHADLMVFETKRPSWNTRLSAWTLNFNGRVKKASKKNFLLVAKPGYDSFEFEEELDKEPGGKTYLRFGKFTKHRFILDFRKPLSPIVAVGICISAFQKKMMVT